MPVKNKGSNKTAGKWFVKLSSGHVTDADYREWQAWRAADPANESAWQKLEQLTSQLKNLSSEVGIKGTLNRLYSSKTHSESRRNALKQMAILMAVGSTSFLAYKEKPWSEMLADYSTSTGEQREIALADGTRLYMNTSTVVNVTFSKTHRILELLEGEVLIETGHEQSSTHRPFTLKTRHGAITALGTRFSARDHQHFSSVSVFEGAVQIAPKSHQGEPTILHAGESMNFTIAETLQKGIADTSSVLWAQGFIIVDQLSMSELIAELSRYRQGLLQCDPRIAHLKVSGSFPTDTDAALEILAHKFPVKIQTFTRYWTTVKPA